jgi:hypothetical protein
MAQHAGDMANMKMGVRENALTVIPRISPVQSIFNSLML